MRLRRIWLADGSHDRKRGSFSGRAATAVQTMPIQGERLRPSLAGQYRGGEEETLHRNPTSHLRISFALFSAMFGQRLSLRSVDELLPSARLGSAETAG